MYLHFHFFLFQENEGTYIGNLNEKSDEILKKNLANSPEGITNKVGFNL